MRNLFFFLIAFMIHDVHLAQNNILYQLNFDTETGVAKYNKAEIGVKLPLPVESKVDDFFLENLDGLNPFDAEAIDLNSTWTSPSGKTQKVNGFYYEAYNPLNDKEWQKINSSRYKWLIRWSPDEEGEWNVVIRLKTKDGEWESSPFNFTCKPSNHSGYLVKKPYLPNGNEFFFEAESDEPFFALGHNISHGGHGLIQPIQAVTHKKWLNELAASEGNFWRLELGMNNYLPSAYDCKNYASKLAPFCELDQIIELSDKKDMHFIAFRHHVELLDGPKWSISKWQNNGYVTQLGLKKRIEYFTSPEAIKWQKNELRYMMARWGYSPAFSFYGYSEIEYWLEFLAEEENLDEIEALKIFTEWFINQRSFIENELEMGRMLYSNTFSVTRIIDEMRKKSPKERANYDIFLASDMIGYHSYGIGKDNNLKTRPDHASYFKKYWNMPVIMEEAGYTLPHLYCATDNNFFNTIWSSSFYGDFGCAMHYWWDRGIHFNNMSSLYKPLKKFTSMIDYKQEFTFSSGFNGNINTSQLAQYSVSLRDSKEMFGFITDPSYNWRNLKSSNEQIKEFLEEGKMKQICLMEDGHRLGEPLSNEVVSNNDDRYKDAYTDLADLKPLSADGYKAQTIKVKGLSKVGLFKKRKNYLIQYFDPRDPNLKILKSEKVLAKKNGSIKITMDASNWPAAAFKVSPE